VTPAGRVAGTIVPVALATALAGCGAGSGRGTVGSGGTLDGRSLFRASGCGGCHTFAAADSTGTGGPSLDGAGPGYARVVRVVTEGSGSMPAYDDTLSDAQIRAIARFVANVAG
jgi:mono/diheme cytochrome c family protein